MEERVRELFKDGLKCGEEVEQIKNIYKYVRNSLFYFSRYVLVSLFYYMLTNYWLKPDYDVLCVFFILAIK